ncbi:MAG: hypothetical protein ABW065_12215 [Solirubrobacterales bacterium]
MLVLFLGLVAALLLASDRAAADEEGGEDNPPTLGYTAVEPGSLGYEGGNVQIHAEVSDDVGVSLVYAQIYGPFGNQSIQLLEGFQSNYFGTIQVPGNSSEQPVEYQVEIQAWDTNNAYIGSLVGSIQVEAAPQFDEAPYISSTEMFPQFLSSEGGPVTIRAEAGDNRALSGLFAMISFPGGAGTEVGMQAVEGNRFEGTFMAPPNAGPNPAEYIVEVVAQDDIGLEARAFAGTVTVEAPPVIPGPGVLETWLLDRNFGSVRVGSASQRVVAIRNVKRTQTGPIEVTARLAGPPSFSLVGSPGDSVHFTLQPGTRQEIPIEFRPTAAGPQNAALNVIRADGGQAGFGVNLSGSGVQKAARP